MKNNVIANQFAISCLSDGCLEIIGNSRDGVVFCLSGNVVWDLRRDLPEFCENAIFTNDIHSKESILIFKKSLGEELRNPRKLLKSIRNKLVQTSFRNSADGLAEMRAMEPTDREEHRMFSGA